MALAALTDAGGSIAAVGALLMLGDAALTHFAAQAVPVESFAAACALCRAGVALEHP